MSRFSRLLFLGLRYVWPAMHAKVVASEERRHWNLRIADVVECPDNRRLARVPDAGKIIDGCQIMHNGIRVVANGYYGDGISRMLAANRGCHEPQEEVVFDAIVRSLPAESAMVEVGAYWGFYSLWFCQAVPRARVYLIEPDAGNLDLGRKNFELNQRAGNFTQAYVGARSGPGPSGGRVVALSDYFAERELQHAAILHADVQGAELAMLQGAERLLDRRAIDYVFVSTHSMLMHGECFKKLSDHGYSLSSG